MVKLYVEGGGDNKTLREDCRRGFRTFLENAGLKGNHSFKIMALIDPNAVMTKSIWAKRFVQLLSEKMQTSIPNTSQTD